MKCQINKCEEKALIKYGSKWICGECMCKIINKQKEKQEQELKELESDL